MKKNHHIKDLGGLPIPVDTMDENVQKAISEIPLACPICKHPVDGFNVDGTFRYIQETSPDLFIIPASYVWEGRCNLCYITWELCIRKRGH
jgi:hypothetical protein